MQGGMAQGSPHAYVRRLRILGIRLLHSCEPDVPCILCDVGLILASSAGLLHVGCSIMFLLRTD